MKGEKEVPKKEDLRGRQFGRLTVVDESSRRDGHSSWWWCECECGKRVEVRRSCLMRGDTKSCGCLNSEKSAERGRKAMTKHGWYGTRVYHIWHSIVDRCESPNCSQYSNYGGRGIKVCDEWRSDPKAFCEWATANGYADNLSIDRIDVNGDYEPSNCRWITINEQQTNKRNNVKITYRGKTQCVAEWARELGVSQGNIYARIRLGWTSPQEILLGR